jgi:hypothetical protein
MKESRKEFILDLHSRSDIGWQKKIEREFPKVFKKDALVVGKWYKCKDYLMVWNNGNETYGFFDGSFGNWRFGNDKKHKLTLATDKELKKALIKEAKNKGFKKGVNINNLESIGNMLIFHHHGISSNGSFYNISENAFWFMGKLIFWNGKWAKIVEKTIIKELLNS